MGISLFSNVGLRISYWAKRHPVLAVSFITFVCLSAIPIAFVHGYIAVKGGIYFSRIFIWGVLMLALLAMYLYPRHRTGRLFSHMTIYFMSYLALVGFSTVYCQETNIQLHKVNQVLKIETSSSPLIHKVSQRSSRRNHIPRGVAFLLFFIAAVACFFLSYLACALVCSSPPLLVVLGYTLWVLSWGGSLTLFIFSFLVFSKKWPFRKNRG